MAAVYILYSSTLDKFYVGSCQDPLIRLEQHLSEYFPNAFTSASDDWILFFVLNDLHYQQARRIEMYIKKMKSRTYIENFKKYSELRDRLITKYQ